MRMDGIGHWDKTEGVPSNGEMSPTKRRAIPRETAKNSLRNGEKGGMLGA
jgi:hypothetical protein